MAAGYLPSSEFHEQTHCNSCHWRNQWLEGDNYCCNNGDAHEVGIMIFIILMIPLKIMHVLIYAVGTGIYTMKNAFLHDSYPLMGHIIFN